MGFTSLGLSAPILKAIEEKGYTTPSPIQEQAIPAVLTGNDIMAAAQTGTGKTAGFTLPILELLAKGPSVRSNQVRALILTPTRELAAQIQENVETYSRHLKLSNTVIFGGVKANPQMQRMRRGADVLVATPGRLLDLFNQNAIKFDQLEVLVLDEADRMLDMGFIHDIRKILRVLPKKRQNLLFSATFSDSIRELAKSLVNNPVEISVAKANSTATLVDQQVYTADVKKRAPMLLKLINDGNWHQVLVFTSTKRGANRLSEYLTENGVMAAAIHGNKSQGARTKALANFKSKEIRVLVATDIAARGIDIPQLPQVVNFDLPNVAEDYVHRIGRTGRAGEVGKAISFVTATDIAELSAIERLIKKVLPRFELEGYPATNKVPETKLDTRPIKPKKPKKPRVQSGSSDAKPAAGGEARRGDAPAKRRSNGSNGYKGKSGSAAKSTGGESRSNSNAKPAGGQRRRKPQPKPSTSNS